MRTASFSSRVRRVTSRRCSGGASQCERPSDMHDMQKLQRLACTLPVGSILGRLTGKKKRSKTDSEVLTNTLCKTSSEQSHACPTATGATTTKDENSTWPETYKTCQHCFQNVNVPASLLDRFAQTCTRPLPMLGQRETCQNMPKHASIACRPLLSE